MCIALKALVARAQRAHVRKPNAQEKHKLLIDKHALYHTLAKLEKAGGHVQEVAG